MCQSTPHEGDVGAGAQPHVFLGVRRGAGEARIDHDQLGAVLLGVQQMEHRDRMGLGRVAADQENRFRVMDVVEAVGHGAVAEGVGHARNRGRMADPRLVVDVVGAPKGGELAAEISLLVAELGRAQPVDRIWPGLLADLQQLVADLVDRLLPADPLPPAAGELGRVLQPPLADRQFPRRRALGAVGAHVDRALEHRLLADPDAVLHLGPDAAADRAERADGLLTLDRALLERSLGLGLADHPQIERRETGEASGREARALEKGAPRQHAVGDRDLPRKPGCRGCLPYSFPQHPGPHQRARR
jgi:hypothetical protein